MTAPDPLAPLPCPADTPAVCGKCRARGLTIEASTRHVRYCGDVGGTRHYVCDGCGMAFTVPPAPPPEECPYPGCDSPRSIEMGGDRQSVFFVHCDGCGACGPRKRTFFAAISSWNAVARLAPRKEPGCEP